MRLRYQNVCYIAFKQPSQDSTLSLTSPTQVTHSQRRVDLKLGRGGRSLLKLGLLRSLVGGAEGQELVSVLLRGVEVVLRALQG